MTDSLPVSARADVVIVGTGIGGSTLAWALRGTGRSVLVLERGPYLPREAENWSSESVFGDLRYRTADRWVDREGRLFRPEMQYYVGGNSKFYGGVLWRLRASDFDSSVHADGESLAWPITYGDLEPYYTLAEQAYGVRGSLGLDPTEPAHSAPYEHAALEHEPPMARLASRLGQRGLHPFQPPIAVGYGDGGPCIRCATCDGFPCRIDAKGDAEMRCLRPALTAPNVTLQTGTMVSRVLTTGAGDSAVGVEIDQDGRRSLVEAGTVVVACGAVNSAALLLRSASPAHPDGLANSSGQVGRNYMQHTCTMLMAVAPVRRNPTKFAKTLAVNDYYYGEPGYPYPMGGLQTIGKVDGAMVATAVRRSVPRALLSALAARSTEWLVMSEDIPHPDNRVGLTSDGRIRLAWRPTNLASHRRLVRRGRAALRRSGYPLIFALPLGVESNPHQCGTARFGRDPATSVLDAVCRSHDVKNLFVVDASFFPSSAAVNPALTIAAQALRIADVAFDANLMSTTK
ncbi:MAG TPA: GMC family oxidoreductase [Streptosporangiaceae bacterium]